MPRRARTWTAVALLLLLGQGVVLAVAGAAAPGPRAVGALALAAAVAAGIALRAGAPRRRALRLGAAASLLLGGLWLAAPPDAGRDDRWERERQTGLDAELRRVQAVVPRLAAMADSLVAAEARGLREGAVPDLAALRRSWEGRVPGGDRFPLALAIWRDGERLDWSGELEPFPLGGGAREVREGRAGWYWRGTTEVGGDLLEWQVRLLAADGTGLPPGVASAGLVEAVAPAQAGWQGNARRGLWRVADIALDSAPGDMGLTFLRLNYAAPPRAADRSAAAARATAAILALWAVAIAGFGRSLAGTAGAVAGLVFGRMLWLLAGLAAWLRQAFPAAAADHGPGSPGSLLDPTYFATRWGGGLFATTLDALLTCALLALVLAAAARAWRHLRGGDAAGASRRIGALALLSGGFAVAMLWLLAELAIHLAEGANARLVGPKVQLGHLSFWILHLALLMPSLGLAAWLAGAVDGLRGRRGAGPAYLAGAVLGAVVLAATGAGGNGGASVAAWVVAPAAAVLAALAWWGGRWRPAADDPVRRLAWLLPVLVAVAWNYVSLARGYAAGEAAWLQAKADEIVQPQQDWVRFLLEDLLAEISVSAAELRDVPDAHAPDAAALWRHWSAYTLWREARIDELRLPCLLELLDDEGAPVSRFASGFFRDQGYEIGSRSAWESGRPLNLGPGRSAPLYLQTESRRYAAGDEHVLRGEVAGPGGAGWISLELPARSLRCATLLDRLSGADLDAAPGGYVPRLEVDQPLLLMRGDARGWRDTGGSPAPDGGSEAAIARLRADGGWGRVRVEGQLYRCLWRDGDGGEGFLLGVRIPGFGDRLLDLSRLALLDLLLAGGLGLIALAVSLALRRRVPGGLGFQERFLAVSLVLGLLPLLLAGTFIDRLSREWLAEGARDVARGGMEAAEEQLQGLLAEQARALAASDYIADLLASRLSGQRPLGPFATRQGMIFAADGELLLDETLSDLDRGEAALLLEQARSSSLVLVRDDLGVYLGTLIPVDLSEAPTDTVADDGPVARRRDGWFFYRQRVDTDLMSGLGDVIQGEATLYAGGEALLASHPEQVFAGRTPLVLAASTLDRLRRQPGNIHVQPTPGRPHAWTGILSLPALSFDDAGSLRLGRLPAALAVTFSARARDFAGQSERTVLFLAGLATLIFVTAALLALVLTWKIFDPVRVLVDATRRLAAGDFTAPLPEPGSDEVGRLSASFGAMRDDLRTAQQALAERERFLARLLERVPVGVAVFDADDRVVTVNPAARAIIEAYFAGDGPPPDPAGADERAARLLAGFRGRIPEEPGEAELTAPDRPRTLRGRLASLDLPGGRRDRLLVFEDVTEFLENRRLAMNAQLARQVAHEIKNPLTPIQLSVQFLQQAWRDRADNLDEVLEATVRQVLEQVELLRTIATEFSLLGRPDTPPGVPVSFPAVVRGVVARYRTPGGGGPDVSGLERDDVPLVLGHADSLAKVVGNLLENSLQAAAGRSPLAVSVGWRVTPQAVTLLWADNGPGLSPEVADRLFDLYFSTKSRGTGLGLSICRNLLTLMQGSITLGNRPDAAGALAEVTLPRADARPAPRT
ncbi:MAG: HAMP domain-containing protein [bacterium]|nr:HAMP domain-containing protein [bacterium]